MFKVSSPLNHSVLTAYLRRLAAVPEKPSLIFLNQLITKHQHTIPFENLTRILDFQLPTKFVTLDDYLDRISTTSMGGVCWSLARGFHWLLTNLHFDVHYLYMSPGHVCLRVELDGPYYVDVGYGAPFFKAMPLTQSFVIEAPSETFCYTVNTRGAEVVRTPGPSKSLAFTPCDTTFLQSEFERGNIWLKNRFLSQPIVSCYFDEKLVRLAGDEFIDYRETQAQKRRLTKMELERILIDEFKMDPRLYFEATSLLGDASP